MCRDATAGRAPLRRTTRGRPRAGRSRCGRSWRVDLRTGIPAVSVGSVSQRRLPAEIYWRRRLLLLAVLILVAWLGLHFWPGAGSDERPVSAPVKTATPSPTPKPAPTDGTTTVALSSDS